MEFTARKVRSAPPDFGSPCVNVSELIPEVVEPGRAILGAMHFDGYACIEFKQDERDGIYRVIDINGRHNLSTMLAVRCGINFPWLHYQHLAEGVAPHAMDFMAGIYWIDILRDVSYSLPGLRSGRYRLGDLIKPYRRAHVFAILDVCDLAPFLKRIGDLVRAQVLDRLPRVKRPTVRVSLAKGKG